MPWLPPDPKEEMRLEIFSPPYLFKKNSRPVIQSAQKEIHYRAQITIQTPQALQINSASLISPGLTTHSFNGAQRLVDIPFTKAAGQLKAIVESNRNIAPPGWYMLFLVDNDGVPSVATPIRLPSETRSPKKRCGVFSTIGDLRSRRKPAASRHPISKLSAKQCWRRDHKSYRLLWASFRTASWRG